MRKGNIVVIAILVKAINIKMIMMTMKKMEEVQIQKGKVIIALLPEEMKIKATMM